MIVLKNWLPTLLTFSNLALGFLALMMLHMGIANIGLGFIILAMFLDGIDGRMARKLNVSNKLGKELDSLSDTISFGVVPAYFLGMNYPEVGAANLIIPLIFLIFGCYRVAKYNSQFKEGSSDKIFYGLPLPVVGILVAFLSTYQVVSLNMVAIFTLVMSGLMVTTIPYPSFKNYRAKSSIQIIVALAIALILSSFHYLTAVLFGIYVISGIGNYFFRLVKVG